MSTWMTCKRCGQHHVITKCPLDRLTQEQTDSDEAFVKRVCELSWELERAEDARRRLDLTLQHITPEESQHG